MSANFGRFIRVMIVDIFSVCMRVNNVEVILGCVRDGISRGSLVAIVFCSKLRRPPTQLLRNMSNHKAERSGADLAFLSALKDGVSSEVRDDSVSPSSALSR